MVVIFRTINYRSPILLKQLISVTSQCDTYPDNILKNLQKNLDLKCQYMEKQGDHLIDRPVFGIIYRFLLWEEFHRPSIEHDIDKQEFSHPNISHCIVQ